MEEPSETFNKEVENIRQDQTEIITELRNALAGFNSILDEVEEQISRLEDTAIESPRDRAA